PVPKVAGDGREPRTIRQEAAGLARPTRESRRPARVGLPPGPRRPHEVLIDASSRLNPKKSQKSGDSEAPENAPDETEDSEQADEPDLDDDAVLAEAELVPTEELDSDTDLEDAPMPVLVRGRAGGS